ncbi:MAG: hypothetical protein M5R36_27770 [Deltaproteobacteria bacterium]|nr:hypothetical protein [Deltaproteobacteria bacterium]
MQARCPHCGVVRDLTGIPAGSVVYCSCGKPFKAPADGAGVPP